MEPALKRCEVSNGKGNCEKVFGIMAARKCPVGYYRYGCCTCVRPCPKGFYDNGETCRKQGEEKIKYYPTLKACRVDNPKRKNDCDLWGHDLYVLRCLKGMKIRGGWCTRSCPNRWPEFDEKWCMKLGTIRLPDYSIWEIRDGRIKRLSGVKGVDVGIVEKRVKKD